MKSDLCSARSIARPFAVPFRAAFQIEALERRRLLAAAASFDPTFANGAGAAAPLPASMSTSLKAYSYLTPAGNGQFYAIAYDGSPCFPSGYTAFQLLRINADGSLDTTFGDGGGARVQRYDPTTLFGYEHFDYDSILVGGVFAQSDGKVLVSYRAVPPGSPDPWILERFNSDGSVDASFGTNGTVEMPVADYSQNVPTTWIQASGKIDVLDASTWHDDGAAENITARQFNSDGTPDESFGTDGVSQTSFTLSAVFPQPTADQVAAAATAAGNWIAPGHTPGVTTWDTTIGGGTALPDGTSVLYLSDTAEISANTATGNNEYSSRIVALTLDAQGDVSTSVVAGDHAFTTNDPWSYSLRIFVQPDGNAVIATPSQTGATLTRVTPDGSPDSTFGAAELTMPGTTANVTGVWFQPDGKLVVALSDQSRELTAITRLTASGAPDATFAGGQVIYGFGEHAAIGGILTNADGSMLVSTDDAEVGPFFWGNDSLVSTPRGAQLVRLTTQGGTADGFDDAGAESAIQAAIAQKAADEAAALAAQQAEYAAEAAAYAAQQAADEAAAEAADGSVLTGDDGSAGNITTIDAGSTDGSTDDSSTADTSAGDLSGDPSAYGYDSSIATTGTDGLFTTPDGTSVWNPDGTPQVV